MSTDSQTIHHQKMLLTIRKKCFHCGLLKIKYVILAHLSHSSRGDFGMGSLRRPIFQKTSENTSSIVTKFHMMPPEIGGT